MKQQLLTTRRLKLLAIALAVGVPARATVHQDQKPSTTSEKGPRPSAIVGKLAETRPPELKGTGDEARKNAAAFIDWAAASTAEQSAIVRRAVEAARENREIIAAFCDEAFEAQKTDHSRALIALSLIGESRSPHGEECLVRFMAQPFPDKGTVVDGEILEQTALATLQAKAIDGLAYLRSEGADKAVLEAAGKHPSRIVRAEAIAAYLWNHEYSQSARETLLRYVRPEERIFLDRVIRRQGEKKETFNRKLAAFLKAHPEARPPAPQKAPVKRRSRPGAPPEF